MKKPTLLRGLTWPVRRMLLANLAEELRTRTPSSLTHAQAFGSPTFLFANWFAASIAEPIVRVLAKNHSRSRLMGPPTARLASQFFLSAGASAKPRARRRSSTLDDWPQSPAKLPKKLPLNVLPPVLGMMLNVGAPRSDSPRPPEIATCTSCALFMSY